MCLQQMQLCPLSVHIPALSGTWSCIFCQRNLDCQLPQAVWGVVLILRCLNTLNAITVYSLTCVYYLGLHRPLYFYCCGFYFMSVPVQNTAILVLSFCTAFTLFLDCVFLPVYNLTESLCQRSWTHYIWSNMEQKDCNLCVVVNTSSNHL